MAYYPVLGMKRATLSGVSGCLKVKGRNTFKSSDPSIWACRLELSTCLSGHSVESHIEEIKVKCNVQVDIFVKIYFIGATGPMRNLQ